MNLFNFNNKTGCYDSISVSKQDILKSGDSNFYQNRNIKNSFLFYLSNPVGCVRELNTIKIIETIKIDLGI